MFRRLLLYGVVTVVPAVLAAEEPAAPPATNVLAEVVVTGTRIPTAIANAPTDMSVISREEIDARQTPTVADVLAGQPGLSVARSGQPGGQTSVYLRGANPGQTLVLIDGVRVNNGFNNAFDFTTLPVDNIERIEILRGPESTLYGSEAMGGVINIVTHKHAAQPTGSATVEVGSHDSLHPHGAFTLPAPLGNLGTLPLAGDGGYLTTDTARLNSRLWVWNGSGRVTWDLNDRFTATVLGTYLQSLAGSPGDRFTNDPNDTLHNETSLVSVILDGRPVEWWDAKLTLSHARERGFFNSPTNPADPFISEFSERTVADRDQVDFQNVFTIGTQHRIMIGGTYDETDVRDDSKSFFSGFGFTSGSTNTIDRTIRDRALYGGYDFTPWSWMTLTVGGRVDDYSSFGTHGTWRTGGRFTIPQTETILRANVGTGFRAPTPGQLYSPAASFTPGNPNLNPEQSLGWDAGVEQPFGNGSVRVGANYFENAFNDLIGRVTTTNVLVNIDRARTRGIETFAEWRPVTGLAIRGAYTWLIEARDLTHQAPLLRRPRHSGDLDVSYRFLDRFTANAHALLTGDRTDAFFDPVTFLPRNVTNPGYVKIDLGLSCDVCRNFTVFGRVENVLNDRYEDIFGYPALGRMFWGGGTVKF